MSRVNFIRLRQLMSWVVVSALVGCGGGGAPGSASVLINGRLIDGYISGAKVFWDCNDNFVPDATEISVVSQAGGRYSIDAAPGLQCQLRAVVPSTAVDEDTGQPVNVPFRMAAIAGAPEVISPLTTAVSLGYATVAELQARFPAGMSLSVSSDYVAAGTGGAQLHNAARYMAVTLQGVDGVISNVDVPTRRSIVAQALGQVPATAFTQIDATADPLSAFRQDVAGLSTTNPASATLDKAEFVPIESAFNGNDDPRRAIVAQVLDTVRQYPAAVTGNVVNWALVPRSARSVWSQKIVDGVNGFSDSPEVKQIRAIVTAAQATASAEIQVESLKVSKKMATVLAKNAANMAVTSIDSAVKILPASSAIAGTLGITRLNKLKFWSIRATTYVNRIKAEVDLAANCAGLAQNLGYIDRFVEFGPPFDAANVGVAIAKCAGGLLDSSALKVVAESLAAGKSYVEGSDESDLLKAAEAVASLGAALLDIGGQPVASALVNETILVTLTRLTALNELQKTGDAASLEFDRVAAEIQQRLQSVIDDVGSAMINARLARYIRPRHLINICLPTSVLVGEDVAAYIDQRLAQPVAYRLQWGRYPDASLVAGDTLWSTGGGSTTLAPVRYTLPGTYRVTVELSDNSLGTSIVPFQILTQDIVVSCPVNTAPNLDGVCTPLAPPAAISFTERVDSGSGWNLRITLTSRDATGSIGTFDFGNGTCTGRLTYKWKDAAGGFVLQENHLTGNCSKTCDIILSTDTNSYSERCFGDPYNGQTIAPANRLWNTPHPSPVEVESIIGAPFGLLNPANGHRYELATCGDWEQCRRYANDRGGQLATIRSQTENDWITASLTEAYSNSIYRSAWIGLYRDPANFDRWLWLSGEDVVFTHWQQGEPNNAGGTGETASMMFSNVPFGSSDPGVWNDAPPSISTVWSGSPLNQAIIEYMH